MNMENKELANGNLIPQIGLGTWKIVDRNITKTILMKAYEAGYRLIDTAAAYGNEISLGKSIAENGIARSELILSDKAWNTNRGYKEVQEGCKKSLKKLKTDYLDIYLMHWPASMKLYPNWAELNADTWRGMEALYQAGLVRTIGVCNFKVHHLKELMKTASINPLINQIECHPGLKQQDILNYCKTNRIQIEASSPLGNGQVLSNETLLEIAKRKKKTAAQICLRWELQNDLVVLPKTVNEKRLLENLDVFDFELSIAEMSIIDTMPYCGGIGIDSDEVTEFG